MTHVDDIDDATATANGELTHTAIWRHKFHTHAFLCVCVLLRRASNGVWGLHIQARRTKGSSSSSGNAGAVSAVTQR